LFCDVNASPSLAPPYSNTGVDVEGSFCKNMEAPSKTVYSVVGSESSSDASQSIEGRVGLVAVQSGESSKFSSEAGSRLVEHKVNQSEGTKPILETVEKVSSKTTWYCGETCPVERLRIKATLFA
jgi:hypothetical protein